MRALVIPRPGDPDVLELGEVPAPEAGAGEVVVRVAASGLNRADLMQIAGRYPAPAGWPQEIPGLEYAGVVESCGPEVSRWRPGDRVMGLVGGGGLAERVRAPASHVMAIPATVSFEEAAAIPEAFITAHDALIVQAGLRAGEAVLIHAVGSGVGTAALQLTVVMGGRALGTSRSAEKLERAARLGPLVAIDTSAGDFADAVLAATDGRGADVVLELVGGDYLGGDVRALAARGRLMLIGLVRGREAPLDMGALLRKRARIIGTALRSRDDAGKADATAAFAGHVLPLFGTGRLRATVSAVEPPDRAAAALRAMAEDESFGKIVVRWG